MPDALSTISTRTTPQSEKADPTQVQNSAGGYTFTVDDMARLRRFLVLGTEGGTYYTGEQELTKENATLVLNLARTRGRDVVNEVLTISVAGRAPKQNAGLFALAAVSALGDDDARSYALSVLPDVARTGTTLFIFAGYAEQFRGWGKGLRKAVARWYASKDIDALAYQLVKYQQREGWTHRDLLRLAHPKAPDGDYRALFDWVCGRYHQDATLPRIVNAHKQAHTEGADVPALIREGSGLSWEMLPPEVLNDRAVWEALLERGVPITALMRQLPRLTRLGMLGNLDSATTLVVDQLTDPDRLRKGRVHPFNILVALKTYAGGQSLRGDSAWAPSSRIVDALDRAFYTSFGTIQPAGKRTLLALDVSGSMTSSVAGLPLSCRDASAALALVTAATEPATEIIGFTGGGGYYRGSTEVTRLSISPRQRLDDVVRTISNLPFGPTDCSLPMTWALEQGLEVDTFITMTDNETWWGSVHPHQALTRYRERTGIPARNIVVAMTSTGFTVNDPSDTLGLDVVGLDSAVPGLIADFSRGLV